MVKVLNMVCHDGHLPKNVVDQGNNNLTVSHGGQLPQTMVDHGQPWLITRNMVDHGQFLPCSTMDRSTMVGDGGQLP